MVMSFTTQRIQAELGRMSGPTLPGLGGLWLHLLMEPRLLLPFTTMTLSVSEVWFTRRPTRDGLGPRLPHLIRIGSLLLHHQTEPGWSLPCETQTVFTSAEFTSRPTPG